MSSSPDTVLLDFAARPPGELEAADATAVQQCQLFHRNGAIRESLTIRREGVIRATYVCRK